MLHLVTSIAIIGSVQFWQRECTPTYECGLAVATSQKLAISETINPPEPGTTLSVRTIQFGENGFGGSLAVYWKQDEQERYIVGQSVISRGARRIAQCSHYASDDTETFLPVGFCAGFSYEGEKITQYGMSFFKE